MNYKKMLIVAYVVGFALAFVGLIYYVKTVPLNEENQKLAAQISALQKENIALYLTILDQNQLQRLDALAEQWGYALPKSEQMMEKRLIERH
ncbi:MAG: hypothetical protein AAB066_00775 [Candidatus Margulisiibacteriota bacterium]